MCMVCIGALQQDEDIESDNSCAISHLTDDTMDVLHNLSASESVHSWSKKLGGILKEFTVINLLIYLVYERDKTFDMQ